MPYYRTKNTKQRRRKVTLLKTPESLLPYPLLLKDGWFGKTDRMQSWPPSPGFQETIFRFCRMCYASSTANQRHTAICFAFLILIQHALVEESIFLLGDRTLRILMSLRSMDFWPKATRISRGWIGLVDINNETDIFCLRYVFLP